MKQLIDLGQTYDGDVLSAEPTKAPKVHYPTLHITADEKIDLPDGEFTFTARGRVIQRTEDTHDEGDEKFRYEIEVFTLESASEIEEESDEPEDPTESLERAMKGGKK